MKFIFKNSYFKAFFIIIIYFLIHYVFSSVILIPLIKSLLERKYSSLVDVPESIKYACNIFLQLILDAIIITLLYFYYKTEIKDELLSENRKKKEYGIAIFWGLVTLYCASFIAFTISNLLDAPDTTSNQETIVELVKSSKWAFFTMLLLVGFVGPIIEELIFRKSFFKLIPYKWLALIISSFIFGIIHALSTDVSFKQQLILSIPYISSGLVFGYTYIKNNQKIALPIMLHSISNLISLFLIIFS